MFDKVKTEIPRAYGFWTDNFDLLEKPPVSSFNLALDIFTDGKVTEMREIKSESIDFQMFRLLLSKPQYKKLFSSEIADAQREVSPDEHLLQLLKGRHPLAHQFWIDNFISPEAVDRSLFIMALDSAEKDSKSVPGLAKIDIKTFNILLNGQLGKQFKN